MIYEHDGTAANELVGTFPYAYLWLETGHIGKEPDMKPKTEATQFTPENLATIHARAQQMRTEAIAGMIRALGHSLVKGWAMLTQRPRKLVH